MNQTEKRESASIGKAIKNATKLALPPLTSSLFQGNVHLVHKEIKSCLIKFYLLDQFWTILEGKQKMNGDIGLMR